MRLVSPAAVCAAVLVWCSAGVAGCSDNTDQYLSDLKSPNPMVRLSAATQARKSTDPRIVAALGPAVADSSATIRARAVESLGIIGDKGAVPLLIRALRDDDQAVRRKAVEALGKLKDASATQPLLRLLKDQERPYDVVWALGQIGSKEAIPVLTPMLDSDDRYLAYNAMIALRKIR